MKIVSLVASSVTVAILVVAPLQAQTVTGSGAAGKIPVWTGSTKIGNSIISQSGTTVTVDGGLAATSASGITITGDNKSGIGIEGTSGSGTGVEGSSTSSYGVKGVSSSKYGVEGVSTSYPGVGGFSTDAVGVYGFSSSHYGVTGQSSSSDGVYGLSDSSYGVYGTSTSGEGVRGVSSSKGGVVGESTSSDGVAGVACSSCDNAAGIVGEGKQAGLFSGNVGVTGTFSVTGLKAFHIDHPLDPANKYLNHFSIESNEVLNTYSGNVITDLSGIASVELPEYFEALNSNYRYQLTVIGQFAQAIVLEEIQNDRFIIKTDKPSVKVSWQVTGVRSDAYVKAHPVPVEEEKPAQERGHYLAPEVFGQPERMSIFALYHPDLVRDAKEMRAKREAQGQTVLQQ